MEQRTLLTYITAGLVVVALVLALFTFALPYDTEEMRVPLDGDGENELPQDGPNEKSGGTGGGEGLEPDSDEEPPSDGGTWEDDSTENEDDDGLATDEDEGITDGDGATADDDGDASTGDDSPGPRESESEQDFNADEAPAVDGGKDSQGTEVPGDEDVEYKVEEERSYLNPIFMVVTVVLIVIALIGFNLVARIEDGVALNGIRRDIFEYIKHNPGEHMRSIMHEFDLSPSATQYHLKVLEDTRQVVSHREAKFKRFYINGGQIQARIQDSGYKEMIGALKNQTTRQMVRFLMRYPGSNQKQISDALGLHPSTVNWHAERLVKAKLLHKEKRGREIVYILSNEGALQKTLDVVEPGS